MRWKASRKEFTGHELEISQINPWLEEVMGSKVDYDHNYGAQCVDLARHYLQFFKKSQFPPVVGAKDIASHYLNRHPVRYAKCGDLVISFSGAYGHVAIVLASNGRSLLVVEQDGYTQKGVQAAIYPATHFDCAVTP